MANRIQQKLMTIPNSANGGVHTANFRVLRLANCPAVLVECGYLSNRSEGNQRGYGAGVYQPSPQIAAQLRPPAEPASTHQPRASWLVIEFSSEC